MIEVLDSTGLRVVGYLVVAAVALFAGFREWREVKVHGADRWPAFNVIAGVLLFGLFVIRWQDFDDQLARIGREQARLDGWYNSRRLVQIAVILFIWSAWAGISALMVWRAPDKRQRYLPSAIMVPSIFIFDAIRAISFHDLETLLYHKPVLGFRLVTVVELAVQAATASTFLWHPLIKQAGGVPEADQPSAAGVGGR